MKPLDMADKYEPLSYEDEEPTIKVDMRAILPKVVVHEEKRYPGVGLLMTLSFGLIFWSFVGYFIFR